MNDADKARETFRREGAPPAIKALDLFCGAGGAALGLTQVGFDVTGVDINDHSAIYPGRFLQGDVLDLSALGIDPGDYDFIWASPPCQAFSTLTRNENKVKRPNLIPDVRRILMASGLHYAIENVPAAPIRADLRLTGAMMGLGRIRRERKFELSFPIPQPPFFAPHPRTSDRGRIVSPTTGAGYSTAIFYKRIKAGLHPAIPLDEQREAMGITTPMNQAQIGEAIPPAYAACIGRWALAALDNPPQGKMI